MSAEEYESIEQILDPSSTPSRLRGRPMSDITRQRMADALTHNVKTIEEAHQKLSEYLASTNTAWIRAGRVLSPEFHFSATGFLGKEIFKQMYLDTAEDPTEVAFVDKHLCGSWSTWSHIKKAGFFQDFYKEVKEEARQRFVSQFIEAVKEIALDPTHKARFSALKYLCDSSFTELEAKQEETRERKRGRPSKSEIEANKVQLLKEDKELSEMYKRLQ